MEDLSNLTLTPDIAANIANVLEEADFADGEVLLLIALLQAGDTFTVRFAPNPPPLTSLR